MSNDLDRVEAAFDALRLESGRLDTAAPLQTVARHRRFPVPGRVILGSALAALIVALGVVFLRDDGNDDVVAGPADDAEDQPGDGGVDGDTLVGTSWSLVEGQGPGGAVAVVEGWPITLVFDSESLGGRAGCNSYGAEYLIDVQEISMGELSRTDMACEAGVMDSEAAFLAAIGDVDAIGFDGDSLILSGPSTELRFGPEAPVPSGDLVGRLWLLETLIRDEVVSSAIGDPATLRLDEDGTLVGGTGCRDLSGDYLITGSQVVFTSFAADGDCPSGLTDQDNMVISVLGDGFTVEMGDGGEHLTVTSVGNEGLGYRAISEDELAELDSGDPGGPSDLDVTRLLDERPVGTVTVAGAAIDSGGGWILCDGADPDRYLGCGGRWVTGDELRPRGRCDRRGVVARQPGRRRSLPRSRIAIPLRHQRTRSRLWSTPTRTSRSMVPRSTRPIWAWPTPCCSVWAIN